MLLSTGAFFGASAGSGGVTIPDANHTAFSADGATTPWVGAGLTSPGWYDSATNRTWFAFEAWLGGTRKIRVGYYDHGSSSWSAFTTAASSVETNDDHGSPGIAIDGDGRIHVFYGGHYTPMKHVVSSSANDNSAWTTLSTVGANVQFASARMVGSTMYLFMLSGTNSTKQDIIVYKSTSISSGTVTWASPVTLFTFGSGYWALLGDLLVDGTDIHIAFCKQDETAITRYGVYYGKYDTTTGGVSNYDGSTTVASGSLPVTTADTNFRIYDHGSNSGDTPSLAKDTNGDLDFVFLDGTAGSYDIKHIKVSSGSIGSATTVASALTLANTSGYIEAISLVALTSAQLEVWYPKDQAGSWTKGGDMTRQVFSSGSWGAAETVLSASTKALARPSRVINGTADARMIFTEIAQDSNDSSAGGLHPYVGGTTALAARSYSEWASWETLLVKTDLANGSTTIPDESPYARGNASIGGDAKISTTSPLIGTGSLALDGTGDAISYPNDTVLSIGNTADRTFECFMYVTSLSHICIIMAKRPVHVSGSDDGEFNFYVDTTGKLRFSGYQSNSTNVINLTGTSTISLNTRYHVAACRSSGTWRLFLDGNLEASGAESGTPSASSSAFVIGRGDRNLGLEFAGKLDEIRAHSAALYTSAFTAPTTAFPRFAA